MIMTPVSREQPQQQVLYLHNVLPAIFYGLIGGVGILLFYYLELI